MEPTHVIFSFVNIDADLIRRVANHLSADEARVHAYLDGSTPDPEVERAFHFFGVCVARGERDLLHKPGAVSMGCSAMPLPPTTECPHTKR